MTESGLELLKRYARDGAEGAFAELVRGHLNLVYSAALRQVRSPQLAEEVAQSVFTDLARNAHALAADTILTAWLYQVTRRTAIDVVRRESRRQSREQIATEINAMNAAPADWTHIEPLLDEAMQTLDDADRAAVLLRYFEDQSFRQVGESLGTTDDAAQKRVSRAVERLREFFAKRGVAVGPGALILLISANAVSAAPPGLVAAISSAAVLAGAAVRASNLIAATKTIAMTTLQKTIITVTLVAAVGAGIYEARETSRLRGQVRSLELQQAPLAEQVQQLARERDDATRALAALRDENTELQAGRKMAEVLKLRGEVGVLRRSLAGATSSNTPSSGIAKLMNDPAMKEYIHQVQLGLIKERYAPLFRELNLRPEDAEKVTQLVGELWLKGSELGSSADRTAGLQSVNDMAKQVESDLQSLLGNAGYARYNEFNREIPARTTLKLLEDHLGSNPLNEDQGARLLQAVKAEPYEATHGIAGELDVAFFGSQQEIDGHLQKVADSNQRILQQAASFLNPEQLTVLATLQSNSVNAQTIQGAALTQKR